MMGTNEDKQKPGSSDGQKWAKSDPAAILVVGIYLVLEMLGLVIIAIAGWIVSPRLTAWMGEGAHIFLAVVLSACAAGIGGSVFMVREYYLKVAYSPPEGDQEPLRNAEIPRFVLLPFSSAILGPVGYALLSAGLLVLGGPSGGPSVPLYSAVVVGFLLGFGYHDTLNGLRRLSRRLFEGGTKEQEELAWFRRLKGLKDDGLITAEQYQDKLQEKLKDL